MTPQMREDLDRELEYEHRQWKKLNIRQKREWLEILAAFMGWCIFFLATGWMIHAVWTHYHG